VKEIPLLAVRNVCKFYVMHERCIEVLRGVDLSIRRGQMLSLVGSSGSGKSTLLHILGALDIPTTGEVECLGKSLFLLNDAKLAEFRNNTIGFVFQAHHLLPEFTALENVAMPALIRRGSRQKALARAKHLLKKVYLEDRCEHKPGELSGGESQRVALARALMLEPALLLADEPTGNLDPKTGFGVMELLHELNRELGIAALVVTHHEALAKAMPFRFRLQEGRVLPCED
jgi:lipoprotein-releasing system ATP-binding protein